MKQCCDIYINMHTLCEGDVLLVGEVQLLYVYILTDACGKCKLQNYLSDFCAKSKNSGCKAMRRIVDARRSRAN